MNNNLLSKRQLDIVNYREGSVVVKACPGSGKTFSVSARLAKLVQTEKFDSKGILALSYTNVAINEIKFQLKDKLGITTAISFPHYLGTIDSFINNYIFLPFGHLIMKCAKRPKLVGEPHLTWNRGKGDRRYVTIRGVLTCVFANPDSYFDCTTFDINDRLIPIVSPREFHFSLSKDKYFNKDGSINKNIQNLINSKLQLFEEGYANQSDANYIALKILERYPAILDNTANKFKYLLVDEAQDTDSIQMRIIELLKASGLNNVMLIGDRDQAIFEWNNAKPELFDRKYDQWDKIDLDENRRSSQKICDFTSNLSSFTRTHSVAPGISDYDFAPSICSYKFKSTSRAAPITFEESKQSLDQVIQHFMVQCEQHKIPINKDKVAILYRGKSFVNYLGLQIDLLDFDQIPWVKGQYHLKDIIQGKHLMDVGNFIRGYQLFEKGILNAFERKSEGNFFCTQEYIHSLENEKGLRKHRNDIHSLIDLLPTTKNLTINEWLSRANDNLNRNNVDLIFKANARNGNVKIDDVFASDLNLKEIHPFFYGTIHSAKGKTFDAVLLLVGKKPGNKSNYTTMIQKGCKAGEEEELRNIYVAITRPRKILMMAVPETDLNVWKKKFQI